MLFDSSTNMQNVFPLLAKYQGFLPLQKPISVRVSISFLFAVAVAKGVPASICAAKISILYLLVDFRAVDYGAEARDSSHLTDSSHLVCTGHNG